jgi:hypothetical protein
MLVELNKFCGADATTQTFVNQCLTEFEGPLYGVEMGIAYGGGLQRIADTWKGRDFAVWGFDTFEGHPKEAMFDRCEDTKAAGPTANQMTCLDHWYTNPEYGLEKCSYEYIRKDLNEQGLTNVHLVKGLVTDQTDVSFIPKLHYAFIDMDFPQAQWDGYNLMKDKIVPGGYLCLHDMIPAHHMPGNYNKYQAMLAEGLFDVVEEAGHTLTVVLKKKL